MHSSNVSHLKPIDTVSRVRIQTKEPFQLFDSKKASKPVPMLFNSHKESCETAAGGRGGMSNWTGKKLMVVACKEHAHGAIKPCPSDFQAMLIVV